jgi:hypothetical protein
MPAPAQQNRRMGFSQYETIHFSLLGLKFRRSISPIRWTSNLQGMEHNIL